MLVLWYFGIGPKMDEVAVRVGKNGVIAHVYGKSLITYDLVVIVQPEFFYRDIVLKEEYSAWLVSEFKICGVFFILKLCFSLYCGYSSLIVILVGPGFIKIRIGAVGLVF